MGSELLRRAASPSRHHRRDPSADDLHGRPVYAVHTDSRSLDGTIAMSRHSETGLGLGFAEVTVLGFDRLSSAYGRVVAGFVIHGGGGPAHLWGMSKAGLPVVVGHRERLTDEAVEAFEGYRVLKRRKRCGPRTRPGRRSRRCRRVRHR